MGEDGEVCRDDRELATRADLRAQEIARFTAGMIVPDAGGKMHLAVLYHTPSLGEAIMGRWHRSASDQFQKTPMTVKTKIDKDNLL